VDESGSAGEDSNSSELEQVFSVFGALDPIDGETVFQIFDLKNGVSFIEFLELLLRAYPIRPVARHLIIPHANCNMAM
jgi:hypothetical protein